MALNNNRLAIRYRCLTAVLFVCIVARLRAELPPEAQAAMKKGFIAAKVPDYLLAIRSFQEARKLAPDAPEVFYNLGLAESKIPGRELRAIAWFGAYLAANPAAPNAATVKEQMDVLDVKNQGNVSRLIKSVQDAASQVSDSRMQSVVNLWTEAGDITAALKVVDLQRDHMYKDSDRKTIAIAQLKAGDIVGAQKTAGLIQHGNFISSAQTAIAEAQIEAGDIVGAQDTLASALKTADLISVEFDTGLKSDTQTAIAEAQIKAGDIAGAQNTLASALKTAGLVKDASRKSSAQTAIAEAQIKGGDIAGAQKTLAAAQKTADLIKDPRVKRGEENAISEAQSRIAQAQENAGDISGAQKTANLIKDAFRKSLTQSTIAEAQAKAGLTNAPNSARQSAPVTQPLIQPVIPVSDWLEKLDDDNTSDCPLNTEPFLDLAGYLKSLPPSDNPQEVFESLRKTAEKILTAQNIIRQMLKRQAKK